MKVSVNDIRKIKAGEVKAFPCKDVKAMFSACRLVSYVKRIGMPSGVSNYETKKDYDSNIVLVRAIAE